jgi:hypothetical protein
MATRREGAHGLQESSVRVDRESGAGYERLQRIGAGAPWRRCSLFELWRGAWIVALISLPFAPSTCVATNGLPQAQSAPPPAVRRSAEDLRAILANQPDFDAAVSGCNVKRPTGDARVGRLARNGKTYRIEFSPALFGPGPTGTVSMGQIV